jgi:hypothetical protein
MKLSHLASVAALAVASTAFVPAVSAAPIATFTNDVTGIFTSETQFAPGIFKGNLTFSFTSLSGPVTFFSALLNGTGYDLGGTTGDSPSFTAAVDGTQPFDLTLLGYSGDLASFTDGTGRYALAISAAVPEAETWALLLAGLLAVGFIAKPAHMRTS